jgi:hypothetical protein
MQRFQKWLDTNPSNNDIEHVLGSAIHHNVFRKSFLAKFIKILK